MIHTLMDKDLKDPTKIKTAWFSRIINTSFLFEKKLFYRLLQLLKIRRKNSGSTLRSLNKAEDCSQLFSASHKSVLYIVYW